MTEPSTTYPVEHGERAGETIVFLHGGNMAGWTWAPQVELLAGRHLLTPDLPGYGTRASERWPGVARAADDIAALIAERAAGGRAHVVGLSLGGMVATHLVHRHPGIVRSCLISGAALAGYSGIERLMLRPQVPLWTNGWYWSVQSIPFGIPKDDRQLFVATTTAASAETNRAMFEEAVAGPMPEGAFGYPGPMLAVCGGREGGSPRRAFAPLRKRIPQLQTWVAPGMHHPWNVEDPALFSRMVATFVGTGAWPGREGPNVD